MKKQVSFTIIVVLSCVSFCSHAQTATDYSGAWVYEVKDTPYGNFFGTIFLTKAGDSYQGKVVNKAGKEYTLDVLRLKGNRLVFASNVEETNSIFNCNFKGDSLLATVEVKGDNFLYILKAKKK